VKSNISNVANPASSSDAATMMFGGVPIRVVRPPSSELNASGTRSFDGGVPVLRATFMTTGSSRAATPTLFMKAERNAEMSMITATSRISLEPASRST
jgi:hypothetical protein